MLRTSRRNSSNVSRITFSPLGFPDRENSSLDPITSMLLAFLVRAAKTFNGMSRRSLKNLYRTAPALPETMLFESRGHCFVVQHGEVAFFSFGRRDEADRLQ